MSGRPRFAQPTEASQAAEPQASSAVPRTPLRQVEASPPPVAGELSAPPNASDSDVPFVPGLALSQVLGRVSRATAAGEQLADGPRVSPNSGLTTSSARRTTSAGRLAWDLLQATLLALVVLVSIRSLVQNFRVNGESMEPTFHDGQALLINRLAYFHVDGTPLERWLPVTYQGSVAYLFGGPRRGDVAVFHAVTERNREYLKRIVGLPGDTVLIDQGVLQVNGSPVAEPYISSKAARYTFPPDRRPTVVPDGSYFVLGDNRAESFDSHEGWFVPVENMVGQVWLIYWPPASWRAGNGSSGPDAKAQPRLE